MKKLSPKQCAELLYELVRDVKKAEVPVRVEQFFKFLVRGSMLAHSPRIIQAFDELSDEQAGVVRVKVTSARKCSRSVETTLLKALGAKELAMQEREDPELIGGLRLEIKDLIIDGTVKTQLMKLKRALTQ